MKKDLLVLLTGFFFCTFFSFCRKDEWDKRTMVMNPDLTVDLMTKIKSNPDLSEFYEIVKSSGWDETLKSSKKYTVWAPSNRVLKKMEDQIPDDSVGLERFIGAHMAFGTFFTKDYDKDSLRIKTLNGKFVELFDRSINGIGILESDMYVRNGVLNVVDDVVTLKENIWELLEKAYSDRLQQAFTETLNYDFVDPDSAEQVGVDVLTGEPLFKPGTGIVRRNRLLQRFDLNSEDSLMTYVLLSDELFNRERQKIRSYFTDSTQALTDSLTNWNIVKDLAFNGIYDLENLPETLYSIGDSVEFHLNENDIVEEVVGSNGIIYLVNNMDYETDSKFRPVIVEGEDFFDRMDPEVNYEIRKRRNPVTDSIFNDILVENHGLSSFWLRYPVELNSMEYRVYWMAVNDFQEKEFPMKVAVSNHLDSTITEDTELNFDFESPYTTVLRDNYEEVYLGNYSPAMAGLKDLFLIGNNVRTNGDNTIVCDYLKFIPIIDN